MINDVCYCGFCQSKLQLEEGMVAVGNKKKTLNKAQKDPCYSEQSVLKQQDKDNQTKRDQGRYIKLDNKALKNNLLLLIERALDIDTTEVKQGNILLIVANLLSSCSKMQHI